MEKIVYLDNNATTAVAPEAFEAMRPFLTELYGNPSSIHTFGGQVAAHVETAREQLAGLLGAQPSEIIFTSCGTESDSSAIYSALSLCPKRRKIVVSCMEHPAILALGKELERRGYSVSHIPVDSKGRLDMECAKEMIDTETAVVSVMWANNEIGNIYPVKELAELAHSQGALFHTDAVQAVGKVEMNLAGLPIDMLSLSGHKLHAPKGVGALYVKRGVRFRPFIVGGHQERGRRAGTDNVASIVALGKAAELASGTITFDAAGRMTNQSCYTWGGSQSPDTNPNSFTEVPDPTNPLNSLQVINLDPTDLNNWYPAEISSNGYPIVVANFSGVLDAQTSGSTNGERYGIELNFGVKVGNFDAPWENTASLGSLAVTPYAQNGAGKSPEYYEINPDYDPKAPWDDRNHYQWKFKGVDYGTPGTAAGDAALLSAIQSMYGNIPVTSGALGTYNDAGGVAQPLPPDTVYFNITDKKFYQADGTPYTPGSTEETAALNLFTTNWDTAQGTKNVVMKDLVGEKLASMTPKDTSVMVAATPANANHVAEFNKPIVLESSACTSLNSSFTANQAQDGYGYGDLTSYNVDANGILYGVYSNGVTLPLAQVCMYDFTCQQGLRREGNNLFSQTRASGEPKSGAAGVAGLGTINSYSLEQSNVDMSTEFVQMITTQRGFQSNSKLITTTDTMLETVISMKR